MKFIDEYRAPSLIRGLLAALTKEADRIDGKVTLMEVCGTHTSAIGRFGLKTLFPSNVRLVSGPGCPVCVTSVSDVDKALFIAGQTDVIFATFGDMLRVPGSGGESLQRLRARGADIRVISSAAQVTEFARENPAKRIILMGIGFETTAPTMAASVLSWRKKEITNAYLLSVHKLVPPALKALISDEELSIDGFICPGHVSTITGITAYSAITAAGKAAVITGFEPADILEGMLMILKQIAENRSEIEIQYSRGVDREGNPRARQVMDSVFQVVDAQWRGLGLIPGSGLGLREEFASYDAEGCFEMPQFKSAEPRGCSCGEILRGIREPRECPLFRKSCTPSTPVGPCMVSSEGTCAAHYKYG